MREYTKALWMANRGREELVGDGEDIKVHHSVALVGIER